ncbi:MAG TPA: PepSY-like domain-containing protein [Methylomirabilota bacterium]|nr:PepSY-like domain-containing protein [Methylomirabilota bacterium]
MNKKLIGISAACALIVGTGATQVRADKVPLTQLPEPVQQAIKLHSQGETLEHVERESRDGQTVYQAEFKRDGLNRRVVFGANGTVVDRGSADLFTKEPSMTVNALPAAVQKTVSEQQAGREIADIDKEMWNGKDVYEVEFKEKGVNSRIHIASDGSMVVDKDNDRNTDNRRISYRGTQLSETPAAVQASVKRVVSNAEIEDVDRETRNGRTVYDVEVKQEGLNRHLKIAEDGSVLADSNNRDSRTFGERVRERIGIDQNTDASTMTLDQLPAAAQKTIRDNTEVGTLKPIKRETRDGRVQYDVEAEKDGKNLRLTVGEDGTLLKDNR